MKTTRIKLLSWSLAFAITICTAQGRSPQDDLRLTPTSLAKLGSSRDLSELQRFVRVVDVKVRFAKEGREEPTDEFLDMVFAFTKDKRENIAFSYDEYLGSVRLFALTRLARLTNYSEVLEPNYRERGPGARDPLNPLFSDEKARLAFLTWYQKEYRNAGKITPFSIEPKKSISEQTGTGQPATRSQSKSEGSDKPQPEAEGRSR